MEGYNTQKTFNSTNLMFVVHPQILAYHAILDLLK